MAALLTPNQRAWVRMLRSGNFEQTTHALKRPIFDGYGYCCYGVAVEKCPTVDWDEERSNPDRISVKTTVGGLSHQGLPPFAVHAWLNTKPVKTRETENDYTDYGVAGIMLDIPEPWSVREGGGHVDPALHDFNDNGFTFDQIADLIEYFGLVPA